MSIIQYHIFTLVNNLVFIYDHFNQFLLIYIIILYYIKFNSKSMNFITVTSLGDVDPCGPSLPLIISDSNPGVILSPNYPSDYPENAYCGWFIQAKEKMKIVLTILEFDTEET